MEVDSTATRPTVIPDDKIALTVSEAAHLMRVSKNTVYRQIQRGELPGVHVGSRVFVPVSAIVDLYENPARRLPGCHRPSRP